MISCHQDIPTSPARVSVRDEVTLTRLSPLQRAGTAVENNMTQVFTWWGTLAAQYPLPVIILSIGFAIGLSTGVIYLQVTTDPIELWASPTSRSRLEKDFFDSNFRPFYRTSQVAHIHSAKILSPHYHVF